CSSRAPLQIGRQDAKTRRVSPSFFLFRSLRSKLARSRGRFARAETKRKTWRSPWRLGVLAANLQKREQEPRGANLVRFAVQRDGDLDVVRARAAERSAFAAEIDLHVRREVARRAEVHRARARVDARFPRLAEMLRVRRWDGAEVARRRRDDRAA